MILQIGADMRAVVHNGDAHVAQVRRRADARQHQQLGAVIGAGRQDDLARSMQLFDTLLRLDLDAGSAAFGDQHAPAQRPGNHAQVAARRDGPQKGISRRTTPAVAHRGLVMKGAELIVTVVIAR